MSTWRLDQVPSSGCAALKQNPFENRILCSLNGELEVKAVLVFAVGMQKHNVLIKRRRGSWYVSVSQSPILGAVHVNAVLLQRGASHLYVCSAWVPSYTEEDMKFGLCQN